MKKETLEVTICFTEPILGTVPKNKDLYADWIATKAPEVEKGEEEIETVEEIESKAWTGFHSDDNGIFIYDYMVKGHLKSACEVMQATGEIKKISAYKKWIDLLVFVEPRRIYFDAKEPDGTLERPLRVMIAQGPRVTLTRSDFMAAGRELSFTITCMKNTKGIDKKVLIACLEYGELVGYGQWRGSGAYGRFTVKKIK